jgi:hypothetical protein
VGVVAVVALEILQPSLALWGVGALEAIQGASLVLQRLVRVKRLRLVLEGRLALLVAVVEMVVTEA